MYKKEMKEGFIQDYMRSRVVAKTSLYGLFRKTNTYEQELNKDCSEFSTDEVINMFTKFNAKSIYVLLNYNTILKAYCAWKGYNYGQKEKSVYEDINISILKPCVSESANKLLTREEVTEIEDNLLNWTDRAIVECLWEGLSGNSMRDLVGIENSMIDHESKQLCFMDGRVFDLTDRLYELLIKALKETNYVCYGKDVKVKELTGYNRLYKERDNSYAMDSNDKFFRWVYRKIRNFRDYLGISSLTMKNISMSGMAYYLRNGVNETGLELKAFLLTDDGQKLMDKYNYLSEFRVDNITHRYKQLI